MKTSNFLLTSIAALFWAVSASSQLAHTWVSGANGNDSTCTGTGTRAEPCASFG
jgi:hypothetical protein